MWCRRASWRKQIFLTHKIRVKVKSFGKDDEVRGGRGDPEEKQRVRRRPRPEGIRGEWRTCRAGWRGRVQGR